MNARITKNELVALNSTLSAENQGLRTTNHQLIGDITIKDAQIAALEAEVLRLKAPATQQPSPPAPSTQPSKPRVARITNLEHAVRRGRMATLKLVAQHFGASSRYSPTGEAQYYDQGSRSYVTVEQAVVDSLR